MIISQLLAQISEYPPVASFIDFWKMAAYITTPIFIGLIVWFVMKSKELMHMSQISSASVSESDIIPTASSGDALRGRWNEILNHIASTREGEWKFAVVEADKLVDEMLKSAGYPGETMGERLMNIESGQLQTLEGLWEAHKTRNRLVHGTNYFLRYAEAKRVIQLYEDALRELGSL